ncbi:MAG: hypothetical protein PVI53_17130 [Desulfobacteraceae bacterium]|jgi:hypothetical protein
MMKRLSSKTTFIYKKLFPLFWFGIVIIFICTGLLANIKGNGPGIIFILGAIGMGVFGHFFMKKFFLDLIDEVYDEGTNLLFRNNGMEFRVNLRDIKNVSYTTLVNPPRVTLSIRYQTEMGDELSFSPPLSWIPFLKNKDIVRLIDRIDIARG